MTTPRTLSERYELGEVLGYGGMSEVHRGLDTRLGRDVAIKVLRADLARDPQFQMRFRREAQNAAALNHPAIVAVYDTGEVSGDSGPLPYIVMEFVDGQTLREIVKTSGPMTQQQVIEVMADVCNALDFSHRHQIIHRDVKPANIMINRAGAVKVMDFGIARALGEGQNVTQTAAVIGTAQYLSPEQARGEAVDARSDVYAAGCVLFELLSGEPPFTGDSPVAVAYQHVREDPKRPSELNPSIPPALDAVVLKALSKNPANRYQSAAEMRSDLVRVRNGQSPMAPLVMSDDERTAMLATAGPATRRLNGGRHTPPPSSGYEDDYYDEEPRKRTGRTVAIVLGVALALGLIGFAAFQIFGPSVTGEKVAIPQMAGQQENDARNALIKLNLKVDTRQEVSAVADLGKVVRTEPGANTQVSTRSTVTLVVGKGPESTLVPNLVGRSPQEAAQLLKDAGLTMGAPTPKPIDDTTKVGKIVESNPAAGEKAPGGSPVAVFVGAEQTGTEIPDLAGKDVGEAKSTLRDLGFEVQADTSDEDTVVTATNPPANSRAPEGSTVQILTSGSGAAVRMPDVRGQDANDARDQLRSLGFTDVRFREAKGDRNDAGKVIDQSVQPRQTVASDTSIVLTVGRSSGLIGGN